jgi:hypothetical protein
MIEEIEIFDQEETDRVRSKRSRTLTDRFVNTVYQSALVEPKHENKIRDGRGIRLERFPRFAQYIDQSNSEELHYLYRICSNGGGLSVKNIIFKNLLFLFGIN